jgi:hypothetical protein
VGSEKKQAISTGYTNDRVPKISLDDAESDNSEGDLADMRQRLAERRRAQLIPHHPGQKNTPPRKTNTSLLNSSLWSDDDSEDELSVRQIIARQAAAAKRKREPNEEDLNGTHKLCNNIVATVPLSGLVHTNDDPSQTLGMNDSWGVNVDNQSSKEQRHLQNMSLRVKYSSSFQEGDIRLSAGSTKAPKQPLEKCETSKQIKFTPNAKQQIDVLQYAVKSTISPVAATGSRSASVELPPKRAHPSNTSDLKQRTTAKAAAGSNAALTKKPTQASLNTDPIIGKEVRSRSNVTWSVHKKCLLVRTVGSCSPKGQVAGFDLDQTLVNWRCAGWPR